MSSRIASMATSRRPASASSSTTTGASPSATSPPISRRHAHVARLRQPESRGAGHHHHRRAAGTRLPRARRAERLTRWFGASSPVVEPHAGGRYSLGWSYKVDGKDVIGGPTRIIEIVPNEKLVVDWLDWRGDASVVGQTIAFTLAPYGVGGTTLALVHSGFGRTADMSDYGFGWPGFVDILKKEAEESAVTAG